MCRNLFVADGGPFVTNPDKNVTWTILALAMRTSEYIASSEIRNCAMAELMQPIESSRRR